MNRTDVKADGPQNFIVIDKIIIIDASCRCDNRIVEIHQNHRTTKIITSLLEVVTNRRIIRYSNKSLSVDDHLDNFYRRGE